MIGKLKKSKKDWRDKDRKKKKNRGKLLKNKKD